MAAGPSLLHLFFMASLLIPLSLGAGSRTATTSPSRRASSSPLQSSTRSGTTSRSRSVSSTTSTTGSLSKRPSLTPSTCALSSPVQSSTRSGTTSRSRSVFFTASNTVTVSKRPSLTVSASPSLNPSLSPIVTFCPLGYAGTSSCAICPIGSYCPLSSFYPKLCPTGTYGSTTGLFTPACSGSCTASPGYFCPPGSTSPTATLVCPVGAYCAGGSAANVSCFPVTACTVVGLSVQPMCYWNVSTLAGSGLNSFADGIGTLAIFQSPAGVVIHPNGMMYLADSNNNRIRSVTPFSNLVMTLTGNGAQGAANGIGAVATLNRPCGVAYNPTDDNIYCADTYNGCIRRITPTGVTSTFAVGFNMPQGIKIDPAGFFFIADTNSHFIKMISPLGVVTTLAGTGNRFPFTDGAASTATFNYPMDVALDSSGNIFVSDYDNHRLRVLSSNGNVSTFAGSGAGGGANGMGTLATFSGPSFIFLTPDGNILQTDYLSRLLRMIAPSGLVTTIAGNGVGNQDGFGTAASFNGPKGVTMTSTGVIMLIDSNNHRIRALTCTPCPTTYYCSSGAPVICPIGSYCPHASTFPTPCPAGTFSNALGAALCTPCLGGMYSPYLGQTSCRLTCEPGYYCPPGSSSMTPCGVSNYCPAGSSSPTPCPVFMAVDAALGPANGPAFEVDTAACLAHCYSGGPGQTSAC